MFSDYDQSRNLVEHLLEDMCRSKRRKLEAKRFQKKKLDMKKKNQQCTRKISDFFRSSKEDVDFDSASKTMKVVFYFI